MRPTSFKAILAAGIVGGFLLLAVGASAGTSWAVRSIGGTGFIPMGMNNAGTVVGYIGWPSSQAVVVRNGVATVLPTPSNVIQANADAINNVGTIIGGVTFDDNSQEAVMWDSGGHMTSLGFLPGGNWSQALDITDRGQIVGAANSPGWFYRAVIWDSGPGSIKALPALPGIDENPYPGSFATAISNSGRIAGTFSAWYVPQEAVVWMNENTVPTVLPPLVDGGFSSVSDINNAGQVVGNSNGVSGGFQMHAALWQSGTVRDLGAMGGTWAGATAINDRGTIVGAWQDANASHAFVIQGSVVSPLNPLSGDTANWASGINNASQVIGTSGAWPNSQGVMWTH
jgi:probable HAF family extracellular repeat protein